MKSKNAGFIYPKYQINHMMTTQKTDDNGSIDEIITCLLPIREPVRITQGFFGKYSHFKVRAATDYSYSLDFAVPVGTIVYAARDGIIRLINDESDSYYEGSDLRLGTLSYPNYIEIEDENRITTSYQHLRKGFAKIFNQREGKKVYAGEPIGVTGLSGWIGDNPHLHFNVYKRVPEIINGARIIATKTIPVKFEGYSGPLYDKDL